MPQEARRIADTTADGLSRRQRPLRPIRLLANALIGANKPAPRLAAGRKTKVAAPLLTLEVTAFQVKIYQQKLALTASRLEDQGNVVLGHTVYIHALAAITFAPPPKPAIAVSKVRLLDVRPARLHTRPSKEQSPL